MSSTQVDFNVLTEKVRLVMYEFTKENGRVGELFNSSDGEELVMSALLQVAELAKKKIKNTKKSHEFAIRFSNEYENVTGNPAPDKVVNFCREASVNALTPYKRLFFT